MNARTALAVVLVLVLGIVGGDASRADAPAAPGQVYAFGYNGEGELGNLAAPLTTSFDPLLVDLPAEAGRATMVAAGWSHSLVATSSGALYTFGSNSWGELGNATGNGSSTAYPVPRPVTLPGANGAVTGVAAGQWFSLAITSSGQLYTFGFNVAGQLGTTPNSGTTVANPTPALVTLTGVTGPVVQASAGMDHSLVLTSTGQAYAFGANSYGQLENGTNLATDNPNPTPHLIVLPAGAGPIAQVAAGGLHSLVLTATGKVYAFGLNVYGQLGNTTNNGLFASNPAASLLDLPDATGPVVQIAAGSTHSLVLTSTGQLFAFGENYYGQLGDSADNGTNTPDPTPVLVHLPPGASPILRIAAGHSQSFALTTTGQLYAWGHNDGGQLGIDTGVTNPDPTLVDLPAGTTIDALAGDSEGDHTMAIVSGLAVLNASLAAGQVGVAYTASAAASGGTGPYTWGATGLAPGLSLDSASGQITGTPTTAGSSSVVLTVRDAHGITVTGPALPLLIVGQSTVTTTTTSNATVTTAQLKASLLTQIVPKGKPAKIAALLKAKHYTSSFKALRAGTLVVGWYFLPKGATLTSKKPKATLVATGKKTFGAVGKATVSLKLTAKGLQLLRTAKRLKITAKDTFTPPGAGAVSSSKSFTLTR